MQNLKNNTGLWIVTIGLLALVLLYPMPFIADDWEHLLFFHKGLTPKILFWVHRNPFHSLWHLIYFSVFMHDQKILAKLLLFPLQVSASWLVLDCMIDNFRVKFRSQWFYGLLPLVLAFPLNNYEWSFWPTMMTSYPSYFLVIFGYWFHHKSPSNVSSLIKFCCYLVGALTFECLLVLAWLLELAHALYLLDHQTSWANRFKYYLKQILLVSVIFIIFKIVMQKLFPYGYAAELGFKQWLFGQYLSLVFSADYYKQFWSLGAPWMLLWGVLFFAFFHKRTSTMLKKDLLLFFFFVASCSYYYYVMNYSSRRALAGPLLFSWSAMIFIATSVLQKHGKAKWPKAVVTLLAILFCLHQGQISLIKFREVREIDFMSEQLRLNFEKSDPKEMFHINAGFPGVYIKQRGWNFVDRVQREGYLRHIFTPQEMERIVLD